MTTDIARMDTNAVAVLGNANDALHRLGQWVTAASQAHQLVAGLIHTAFIPESYRVKIDQRATDKEKAEAERIAIGNATAAVLQGVTLGIDPLTALQQIYIIHGRPGLYAKLMVALIQAHGHEVWTEDLSDTRCTVAGRRKGAERVERRTVSMDQARKAGWTKNEAYGKTPQDMLWARAAARVCDAIASDVLKGIVSVEEIQDEIQATAEVGNGQRVVRRKAPAIDATTVDEPPLEENLREEMAENAAIVQTLNRGRLITPAQQRKLHALLRDTGRGDRDLGLVYIAGVLEREIESTKELSVDEAGTVIAALEADAAGQTDDDWPPTDPALDTP